MRFTWISEGSVEEKRVRVWAPAKVNLYLKVIDHLPSGYHEIESLMIPITLADEVVIAFSGTKKRQVEIACSDSSIPVGEGNLAYKAVIALEDAGYAVDPLSIHITKRIPAGAGLGGGSSDAAAVLKGLDYLLDLGLSPEVLREIGLKVGADVPFFLMERPCLVAGIGERLTPLAICHDMWLAIGFPGFAISTKRVYEALDLELTNRKAQVNMPFSLEGEDHQGGGSWSLINDLETPVFVWYPALRESCKKLRTLGALEARMTGSGSSIFGIFEDRARAETAVSEMRRHSPEWKFFLARPVWKSIESWRKPNGSDRGEGFSR